MISTTYYRQLGNAISSANCRELANCRVMKRRPARIVRLRFNESYQYNTRCELNNVTLVSGQLTRSCSSSTGKKPGPVNAHRLGWYDTLSMPLSEYCSGLCTSAAHLLVQPLGRRAVTPMTWPSQQNSPIATKLITHHHDRLHFLRHPCFYFQCGCSLFAPHSTSTCQPIHPRVI